MNKVLRIGIKSIIAILMIISSHTSWSQAQENSEFRLARLAFERGEYLESIVGFEELPKNKYPAALVYLGVMHTVGLGLEKNIPLGKELLNEASNIMGKPEVNFLMAKIYSNNKYKPYNSGVARRLLIESSKSGHLPSQELLAIMDNVKYLLEEEKKSAKLIAKLNKKLAEDQRIVSELKHWNELRAAEKEVSKLDDSQFKRIRLLELKNEIHEIMVINMKRKFFELEKPTINVPH